MAGDVPLSQEGLKYDDIKKPEYNVEYSSAELDQEIYQDGAEHPLSEVVKVQAARIKELEYQLADARKVIHSREQLLEHLQWQPKEDYYAWKNPTITDKNFRDAQERKLKTLLEQMRVMEKVLAERDQVLSAMVAGQYQNMHYTTPASSIGSSSDSPPNKGLSTESPDKKSSWWIFKSASNSSSSLRSSSGKSVGSSSSGSMGSSPRSFGSSPRSLGSSSSMASSLRSISTGSIRSSSSSASSSPGSLSSGVSSPEEGGRSLKPSVSSWSISPPHYVPSPAGKVSPVPVGIVSLDIRTSPVGRAAV